MRSPPIQSHPTSRLVHRAFTLIELLVSLAVLAILGSLLVQTTRQAFEKSNLARCSSNLRHIVTATHLQLSDSNNIFPSRGNHWLNYGMVAEYLLPYVGESTDIFQCPSNQANPLPTMEIVEGSGVYCQYEFNSKLATYEYEEQLVQRSMTGVLEPGIAAYAYDRPYWKSPERPHRHGANVAFIDGHVEFLDDERLAYEGPEEAKFYNLGHTY